MSFLDLFFMIFELLMVPIKQLLNIIVVYIVHGYKIDISIAVRFVL